MKFNRKESRERVPYEEEFIVEECHTEEEDKEFMRLYELRQKEISQGKCGFRSIVYKVALSTGEKLFADSVLIEKYRKLKGISSIVNRINKSCEQFSKDPNIIGRIIDAENATYFRHMGKDLKILKLSCRYNVEKLVRKTVRSIIEQRNLPQNLTKKDEYDLRIYNVASLKNNNAGTVKDVCEVTLSNGEKIVLLRSLYESFKQDKEKRIVEDVTTTQDCCRWVKIVVGNYFRKNIVNVEDDIEKYVQKVTDELCSNMLLYCGGCYPSYNIEFQKLNGNIHIRGLAFDNITLIKDTLRNDDYFRHFFLTYNENLLPDFFDIATHWIPDIRDGKICIPQFIIDIKKFLYYEICKSLTTVEEYVDVFEKLEMPRDKNKMGNITEYFWNSCCQYESKTKAEINSLSNLIDTLYRISGGSFVNLRKFAELLTIIFLGPNYVENNFFVIRTNNAELIKKFLADLVRFNVGVHSDLDKVGNTLLIPHDSKSFTTVVDRENEVTTHISRSLHDDDPYHYTEYSVAELGSKNKLNSFLQDTYFGHFLNVTDMVEFSDSKKEQLKQLSDKKIIEYQHEIFGHYSFQPQGIYVFLADNDSVVSFNEAGIKSFVIDIGTEKFGNQYSKMTYYEKAIVASKFVIWGYRQLQKEKLDIGNDKVIDLKKEFMDRCLKKVVIPKEAYEESIDDMGQKKNIFKHPGVDYSVQLKTINSALDVFLQGYESDSKLELRSSDFNESIGKTKSKCLREYYMANMGYDEDDVLGENSNSPVVYGYVLKAKGEALEEGKNLRKSMEKTQEKLDVGDFIIRFEKEILSIKIKDLYSWGSLYSYLDQNENE